MTNIICVKWGTAYSSMYVNRLYSMVSRHFHKPFKMYCLTDNEYGIDERIKVIPMMDLGWEKWWTKITLFNSRTQNYLGDNLNLFFDLDTIIYNDITPLIYEATDHLTIAECHWVDPIRNLKGYNRNVSCDLNSSIMMWRYTPEVKRLHDFFQDNQEELVAKYKGIDKVLYYHEFDEFEIRTIDDYWVQSYHHMDVDLTKGSVLIFNQGKKQTDIDDPRITELWK